MCAFLCFVISHEIFSSCYGGKDDYGIEKDFPERTKLRFPCSYFGLQTERGNSAFIIFIFCFADAGLYFSKQYRKRKIVERKKRSFTFANCTADRVAGWRMCACSIFVHLRWPSIP